MSIFPSFVGGRYKLLRPLAEDREENDIHLYLANSSGKLYAAKIQKIGRFATLDQEIDTYKAFANSDCIHIPEILWHGSERGHHVIIMPLYEIDLWALFATLSAMMDRKYLPTFVAFFASDMTAALEFIHSKDIVHCDIRPANFLWGTRSDGSNGVVLIDFEASCKAGKRRSGPVQYMGDVFFASVHMLRDRRRSHKGDDRVALAYVLAYLGQGMHLPWELTYDDIFRNRTVKSKTEYVKACEILAQAKLSTEDSCCRDLPQLFDAFLRDSRNLSDSAFNYKRYASEFDKFVKDNQLTCLLELVAQGMFVSF